MKNEKAIDLLKRLRIGMATSSIDGVRVLEPLNIAIEAVGKQISRKAVVSSDNKAINIGEEPDDSIFLNCPICKSCVGQLCEEDADGDLKYNIFEKFCSNCGQSIEQIYTKDDYKNWGIEID